MQKVNISRSFYKCRCEDSSYKYKEVLAIFDVETKFHDYLTRFLKWCLQDYHLPNPKVEIIEHTSICKLYVCDNCGQEAIPKYLEKYIVGTVDPILGSLTVIAATSKEKAAKIYRGNEKYRNKKLYVVALDDLEIY